MTLDLSFISILTVSFQTPINCFIATHMDLHTFPHHLDSRTSFVLHLVHLLTDCCYRYYDHSLFKQVMPAVVNLMKEESTLVTLVKPQFEARRSQVKISLFYSSNIYVSAVALVVFHFISGRKKI